MRNLILSAVMLSVAWAGLAAISGDIGINASWRAGSPWDIAWVANLSYSADVMRLAANLSLPFPDFNWGLNVTGTLYLDPLRLRTAARFQPEGLTNLSQQIGLVPAPWEVPGGELRTRISLRVNLRSPLSSPDLTANASFGLDYGTELGLRLATNVSVPVYPFPPTDIRWDISLSYRPSPWSLELRGRFVNTAWDNATFAISYWKSPFSLRADVTFGPGGFEGANVTVGFNPSPAKISVALPFTDRGLSDPTVSLDYRGDMFRVSTGLTFALPFDPRNARVALKVVF